VTAATDRESIGANVLLAVGVGCDFLARGQFVLRGGRAV
jgi:hypothetical protein